MQIIDPVTLGDVACTRASPKWVFDRTGTLVQVPANTLAVTYDPSDLSKAPYAVAEQAATNLYSYSNDFRNAAWSQNDVAIVAQNEIGPDGQLSAIRFSEDALNAIHELRTPSITLTAGVTYTTSIYAKAGSRYHLRHGFSGVFGSTSYAVFDLLAGAVVLLSNGSVTARIENVGAGWFRCIVTYTAALTATGTNYVGIQTQPAEGSGYLGNGGGNLIVSRAQMEVGTKATSPIDTGGSVVTRAADVIASGAGLVYSNTPIDIPTYSAGTTYAKDALAYDPVEHEVYQSLIANNVGKALTDTTAWTARGAITRWAMFDEYNNTQTSNAEEILVVVSPQAISRGLYIGNVDASEMRLSVVDLYKGLVYQEAQNLRVSTSGASFYNWGFNRIKRRAWSLSLKLPPYANALVTLCLRKPGGTAKCGMFATGPIVDLGKTLMGLGAEIKDFSETSFNFDGTSKTTLRPWAKRITADVSVDSDQVDAVYDALADYRQRPIVWIGSPNYGLSIAFGRYSSFKPVIKGSSRWEMTLQIEGTV